MLPQGTNDDPGALNIPGYTFRQMELKYFWVHLAQVVKTLDDHGPLRTNTYLSGQLEKTNGDCSETIAHCQSHQEVRGEEDSQNLLELYKTPMVLSYLP